MAPGKSELPNEAGDQYPSVWTQANEDARIPQRQGDQALRLPPASWPGHQMGQLYGTNNGIPSAQFGLLTRSDSFQRSYAGQQQQQDQYGQRALASGAAGFAMAQSHQDVSCQQRQQQHQQHGNPFSRTNLAPKIDREIVQDLYRLLQGSAAGDGPNMTQRNGAHLLQQFQQDKHQASQGHPMYPSLDSINNRMDPAAVFASVAQQHQFEPSLGHIPGSSSITKDFLFYNQGNLFDHQADRKQAAFPMQTQWDPALQSPTATMDRIQADLWSSATPYSPPPPPLKIHKPVLRALSAYNFFFRDERDRIVGNLEGQYDTSEEKKKLLLDGHWHRDRTTKRRHRKTHGKIAFTDLSKVISKRWKQLEPEVKAFYRDVAADDLVRYHKELEEQKASLHPDMKMPPGYF